MPLGYVYILSNPSIPGLLKIGFTLQDVDQRAKELASASGVPSAFSVEYWHITDQPECKELQIHEALSKFRTSPNREFFKVSVDQAIATARAICSGMELEYVAPREIPPNGTCWRCGYEHNEKVLGALCPKCGY